MAIAFRAAGTTSKVASGNMAPGLPAGHTTDDILVVETSQQDNVACSVIPGTGGPVVRAVGSKTNTAQPGPDTSAITPGAPIGIATGDLELLIATTIAGATVSITADGGGAWTAIDNSDVASGERIYAWYRIRAGGDGNPSVQPSSDHCVAERIAVYGGSFDTATPIEIVHKSSEATSDTSFSYAPGTSTTVNNCLCFVLCSSGVDSTTGQAGTDTANSNLTSIALQYEHQSTSGGGGGSWGATGFLATAGAVGTWTQTMTSASPKAYISFAVRPSTTGYVRLDSSNDGASRRGEIWAKRDNGSESAPTIVHSGGGISNSIISAYSGVDNGLTISVGSGGIMRDLQLQKGTSTTTFTAPALTGVVSGDMLHFYGLFTVNDTSGATTNNWGTVSGWAEEKDDCSSLAGAWAVSFGIDDLLASGAAGSVTSAVGWGGAFGATYGWICWQLALSSASSGAAATSLNMDLFDRRTPRRRSMQRI